MGNLLGSRRYLKLATPRENVSLHLWFLVPSSDRIKRQAVQGGGVGDSAGVHLVARSVWSADLGHFPRLELRPWSHLLSLPGSRFLFPELDNGDAVQRRHVFPPARLLGSMLRPVQGHGQRQAGGVERHGP